MGRGDFTSSKTERERKLRWTGVEREFPRTALGIDRVREERLKGFELRARNLSPRKDEAGCSPLFLRPLSLSLSHESVDE